jgi:hypothetical protein
MEKSGTLSPNLVVCPKSGCNSTHFIIYKESDMIVCAECGRQIGIFARL